MTEKGIRSGDTPMGQKQTDDSLRESERRYRLLFENMITGFALLEMVYDESGSPIDYRFLDANPAFGQLTGLPVASILGRTVREVLPGTEQRWVETYAKVVQTGTPVIFEDYSSAVGKWFETRAFHTTGNQFATVFADVTERKRAEMGLRESEERFRAIFDQAAVGVALLNTKTGRFVRINQRYCDFLGYTMQEMLQKTFQDVTFSEDIQQNVRGNRQLIEGSIRAFSCEKRYVRKDGSLMWGSLTISPLWKTGEKPATYLHIAIVEDITERKGLEHEVVHLASFPAQNPHPVLEVDTDGAVCFANAAAAAALVRLGLSPDARQFLPGTPAKLALLWSQCEKQPQTQELQLGGAIFLRVVSATGERTLRVYATDITERKRSEEQLRETTAYLNNLLDYANAPVIVWDPTYRITLFNHAFERLTGHSAASVLGEEVNLLFPSDKREKSLENIRQASSGKRWETLEIDIQHLDGTVRTLLWNSASLCAPDGVTVIATIAQGQDITERKQAEQALADSHATLVEAQAIAHIGDWSMDTTTRTFVWSDEMYVIHGMKPGSPIPHNTYLGLIHPEDRQRVFESMQSAMAGKQQEFLVDYRIMCPDGPVRFVTLTGKTVLDSSGAVTGIRGTTQDVTDRRQVEAEREAMQAKLLQSKKLEAVGQLAGGVAHNFNNLLTGIMGYIDIARSDLDPRHPATSSLNAARTAVINAASLARKLLAVGRSAMVVPCAQNAATAVQEALDLVCPSVPDSIEVVRDVCLDAWDIMVDSSQLTQVLMELMNNAQEAMSDVGTITVRTRNVVVDDAYVATAPFARTGDFIVISVADTGPGIPPDMLSRLFEPFATTKQYGRGMGLSAVFGTLKQAGGWSTVASEPNAGTKVNLYFPRYVAQTALLD
jgi:PAS domain S-box-containing protein